MVDEVRRLIFTDAELMAALSAIMAQRGTGAPAGGRPTMLHSRDAGGEVMTVLHYGGADGDHDFDFNARELTAAMVNYCIEAGIPLPRQGAKTADIHDGRMALVLTLTEGAEATPATADAPPRRRHG